MSLKQSIEQVDRSGMLAKVLAMPEHFRQARAANAHVELPFAAAEIRNVVVAGMGGSAISGDVVRCLCSDRVTVPVAVNRHYVLPSYVKEDTLVVVSSYSGNTEETLAALETAQERGAKIVCISSDGRVAEAAGQNGYPLFTLPPGYPPRSALVWLTVPLLQIFSRLGWIDDAAAEIEETAALLERLAVIYGPENEDSRNVPLAVARAVLHRIPVVYCSSGLLEAAGLRWRGQFSENAEILAYGNFFPEMNHNELVGWGQQEELDRAFQVIYLRDRQDHPRVKLRMDVLREIIEQTSNPIIEVWSEGESPLARLFSLIFIGDLASVYTAAFLGVDPTPVKKIDYLKATLARRT